MEQTDGGPVVLLVDDQAIVGAALRKMLADQTDIQLHVCAAADQALATAVKVRPTTILQDLVMPGVDGFTMVQQYRDHPATAQIPVIMLSSKDDPQIKSDAFARGASDYLVKLPDRIELIARIRAHSRSYRAICERDAAFRSLQELRAQLEQKNAILERLSALDGLTGVANRRRFEEMLMAEWRRCARDRSWLSLILVDVDHFKAYNDHYGHLGGDDCLRQVAGALASSLRRPGDLLARYGGEEFAVLLPGTDPPGTSAVAESLREQVELLAVPHARSSAADVVTISLGSAAVQPDAAGDRAQLIARADAALYEAKRSGRNRHRAAE
jgi:two-component system chemotaxis family response regulator WspR